jgi:IS30 family transposase
VRSRRIGRHFSVVTREIARNGGRSAYRAVEAQQNAIVSAQRPNDRTVERDPAVLADVTTGLALRWSPQQISARWTEDVPEGEPMRVSHASLYPALFVQATGHLNAHLVGRLRTGKIRRVSPAERRVIAANKPAIRTMVMITPASARGRGPGRTRPLGGRLAQGKEQRLSNCDLGGAWSQVVTATV